MADIKHVARRITICASLALVAAMVTAIPLKPAAAESDWNNGQWRSRGNSQHHYDRNWYSGGYGGGGYYQGQSYYYAPRPYYYQPAPYYQPRPYYAQPGINFNVVIP